MTKTAFLIFSAATFVCCCLFCGCRIAGASGFAELTQQETTALASYAGDILRKAEIIKDNQKVPTAAAKDHIYRFPPHVRIDYSADCYGLASFTWQCDNWQYRIYCRGQLDGNFSDLDWCIAVAPPAATEDNISTVWNGPSPDLLELQMLHQQGVQLLPARDGKLEYEFADESLREELIVEGAVVKGTGGM